MLNKIVLFLSLCSAGSSLSCRWMDHKFRQYSETSINLLNMMAVDSTSSTVAAELAFPTGLYVQASKASAEDRLAFTVQMLDEVADLFQEDQSSASWEENTVDDFLNIVFQQADGLRSCIGSFTKNKRLHMYFRRLSHQFLPRMGHSAEAWELVRSETKILLFRAQQLALSVLTTN